jgi:hypothetical protein
VFTITGIRSNKEWQSTIAKLGSWFMSGEIQYFENATTALEWLKTNNV